MRIHNVLILCACLFLSAHAEQFKMKEGVIKAKISYQHLNRISVKVDKIDSILGIDTAFYIEKNEKTGEAFLRPTDDNGYTPISLSITTMSGKTQDLLLEPVDGEQHSIELIADIAAQEDTPQFTDFPVTDENNSSDYEGNISSVMKKFINLPPHHKSVAVKGVADRTRMHLKAEFQAAYMIDGFLCLKFKVTSKKEGTFELNENMFSEAGDVLLSLSNLKISNMTKDGVQPLKRQSGIPQVTLYIVRK